MSDPILSDLASLKIDRDQPPPRTGRRWWLIGAAVAGGLSLWIGLKVVPDAIPAEVAVTQVSLVSPARESVDLTATGYVVPQAVVKMGAKLTGRISRVAVAEGSRVQTGAVLFELDAGAQHSALATTQARASAVRARAVAAQNRAAVAQATLQETKLQYDRQAALAKEGAVATATVTDLEARMHTLRAQLRSAEADAKAAQADAASADAEIATLRVDLANTVITAPCDCIAQTKPAGVGDVVVPGTVLVELASPGSLLVEVDVPEAKIGRLRPGTPCEVVLDAYPDKRLRGAITDVSPRLNRAKATGTAKVRLIDQPERLLPEMAARVSFLAKALDPAVLNAAPKPVLPASAIAERQGGKVVFAIEKGKLRQVPIVLGPPMAGGFELQQGPEPGVRLVSNPGMDLKDGQRVKEKEGS